MLFHIKTVVSSKPMKTDHKNKKRSICLIWTKKKTTDSHFGILMKPGSKLDTHIKTLASVKNVFLEYLPPNKIIQHFEKLLIHNLARELNKQTSLIQVFSAEVYSRKYCIILHESSYQCHFNATVRVGDN